MLKKINPHHILIFLSFILLITVNMVFKTALIKTVKATPSSSVTKHAPAEFIAAGNGQIDLSASGDHIYEFTNDVIIDNPADITGNNTGVIFIDGNLTIGPITNDKLEHGNNNSGLVFIVKGNVYIDKLIKQIDAVIITEGIICTAATNAACPATNVSAEQLIINGSLISLNQSDTIPVKFMRTRGALDASEPAEKIVYQPKYLVILRNLVSDTFQKWSEIQP